MSRSFLIGALLPCLLVGCYKVGPDYVKPETELPGQWRFGDVHQGSQPSLDASWWRRFKDPVLERLIDTAVRNNLDLNQAVGRVEQFMGTYGAVRSILFPQIIGAANIAKIYNANNQIGLSGGTTADGGEIDFARMGGGVEWEIDVWGQLRRAKESARAELLSQEAVRRAILLTVVTQVTLTYVELRLQDADLDITRSLVATLENELRIATTRFKEGYSSELDLNQVQSEYHRRAAFIPKYEKAIAETEHALCLLLGQAPGPIPRGRNLDELMPLEVPRGLPADLLRQRPDIQKAEQDLIAANARIGVAIGEYFPKIMLTADAGQATTQLATMFTPGANFWALGSGLVMPIFTAGKIAGHVQAAEGRTSEALARYRQTVLNAMKEVEDALIGRTKNLAQLQEETARVKATENYFKLSRLRYDEGYTDYLTVLDSLRQLFDARIEQAEIKTLALESSVSIYRAMGGGWIEGAETRLDVPKPKEATFFP